MTADGNKLLIRRLEDAFTNLDADACAALFAPDVAWTLNHGRSARICSFLSHSAKPIRRHADSCCTEHGELRGATERRTETSAVGRVSTGALG